MLKMLLLAKRGLTLSAVCATLGCLAIAQGGNQVRSSEPGRTAQSPSQSQPQTGAVESRTPEETPDEQKEPWHGLNWRLVGPFRGGRVLAVSGVVGDSHTYYFGSTGGGVWKSTDGGLTWRATTDKTQDISPSIGAIAVAPSDANVIYAGTGEACIRGDIIAGNGVYKSIDGGKTWSYSGLKDTGAIGRLIVHPKNADVAFVAALGHPFAPNSERGIFRTRDGGKTWTKVLFKDENTGGIDLAFDPANPNIIFASLWQARRSPWGMDSGGPGSGLYRSTDGGDTWKRLSGHGLPDGILGRIGVAVAYHNPNRVWALVEAEKGGLFRSDDSGENWMLVNSERQYRQRAFYYTHIFADPRMADGVYVLNTGMYRSNDAGKTFHPIRVPHGDNHGLWIDPNDPDRMIESNDGGANVSTNGGATWTAQSNQPTAQFYHVVADSRFPYWIYGAQQDNTTVGIASASNHGPLDRSEWYPVGGGESGYVAPDPHDPEIIYAGSYGGQITRYDHRTGEEQNITPWPLNPIGSAGADQKYRFQWTEPIVFSPHDSNTLYFASQVLFKTTDHGVHWDVISPDLTRNDPAKQQASGGPITKDNTGVEVYDTIFSLVESPLQKDLIWAGSDDGLVHITTDGGKHWSDVTPKMLPEWGTVSMIEASPRNAGTAYIAVQRHKMDDFSPYAFKTTDFGKTWTTIARGIPAGTYIHAIREDRTHPGLLYAGTEKGVYVSWDAGANWQSIQANLPVSPVYDLYLHDRDLIVATHGRSFWILDDLAPLQQYRPQIANEDVHLYAPSPAGHSVFGGGSPEAGISLGQNPPAGAVIYYSLKTALKAADDKTTTAQNPPASTESAQAEPTPAAEKKKNPPIKLEILDASGRVIRTYPPQRPQPEPDGEEEPQAPRRDRGLPAEAGLNRFIWDLRYEGASRVPHSPLWAGSTDGPKALPGTYQVRLTVNGKSYTEPLEIKADPRLQTTQDDLRKQFDLLLKIRDRVTETHDTVNRIREIRGQIEALNKRLENDSRAKEVADAGRRLNKKMTDVEEALIQTKIKSNQDMLNYPIRLNNQFVALGGVVGSADTAPTQAAYDVYDMLNKQLETQMAQWRQILQTDLPAYNDVVQKQQIPAVIIPADASLAGGGNL
jgi:photosystem II stability/assembly factor-like uncharacterized protein/DNA-binding FrmR family transcriptional regulator